MLHEIHRIITADVDAVATIVQIQRSAVNRSRKGGKIAYTPLA